MVDKQRVRGSQARRRFRSDDGFTMVEVMVAVMLMSLVVAIGGSALREYWFKQGLDRSSAAIATEMRGAQQRAMSESHPLVYGIRLTAGSSQWSIVRFDPTDSTSTCTEVETHEFATGVNPHVDTAFSSGGDASTACSGVFGTSSDFVFFFPRGTATEGRLVLRSPHDDELREVVVYGVTGRVEEQE